MNRPPAKENIVNQMSTSSIRLSAEDFAAFRSPRNCRPTALSNQAIDWILYLPREIRPKALSQNYPRIANLLAEAWLRPQNFKTCLDEFLHDKRPNRQGFPEEVATELKQLESYFNKLQCSAWDSHAG